MIGFNEAVQTVIDWVRHVHRRRLGQHPGHRHRRPRDRPPHRRAGHLSQRGPARPHQRHHSGPGKASLVSDHGPPGQLGRRPQRQQRDRRWRDSLLGLEQRRTRQQPDPPLRQGRQGATSSPPTPPGPTSSAAPIWTTRTYSKSWMPSCPCPRPRSAPRPSRSAAAMWS